MGRLKSWQRKSRRKSFSDFCCVLLEYAEMRLTEEGSLDRLISKLPNDPQEVPDLMLEESYRPILRDLVLAPNAVGKRGANVTVPEKKKAKGKVKE